MFLSGLLVAARKLRPCGRRARLLLLVLMVLPTAATFADTNPLTVMSFNLRVPADTNDNRWDNRRALVLNVINAHTPDVIGTQELTKQQANDLIAGLPQYAWFGEGRHGGDRDEHVGVFYRADRLHVLQSGNFWLSETPDIAGSISWGNLYPRLVTWARFQRNTDGLTFTLYNTHFPYRDQDHSARLKSAQLIINRLATTAQDEPIILTGDFNTTDTDPAHATLTSILEDAWLTAAPHLGPAETFHNFTGNPDRRIDWVLFRGLHLRQVQTVTTHQGPRYPSDHFPVLAAFDLLTSPAG